MRRAINISFSRFMELAVNAGHVNEGPFGSDQHISLTDQLNYIKFAHAVAVANDQTPIIETMMNTVIQMAKDHGGYSPRECANMTEAAIAMQTRWESEREMFFVRYAHAIAVELEG